MGVPLFFRSQIKVKDGQFFISKKVCNETEYYYDAHVGDFIYVHASSGSKLPEVFEIAGGERREYWWIVRVDFLPKAELRALQEAAA